MKKKKEKIINIKALVLLFVVHERQDYELSDLHEPMVKNVLLFWVHLRKWQKHVGEKCRTPYRKRKQRHKRVINFSFLRTALRLYSSLSVQWDSAEQHNRFLFVRQSLVLACIYIFWVHIKKKSLDSHNDNWNLASSALIVWNWLLACLIYFVWSKNVAQGCVLVLFLDSHNKWKYYWRGTVHVL